tara:strand:- start:610 stop:1998 length:1389 start_codon:yes stop_codon:yes gene_type:complete
MMINNTAKILTSPSDFNFKIFMDELQKKFGRDIFISWFGEVRLCEESDFSITLSVRLRFVKEWILVNHKEDLLEIIREQKPKLLDFDIIVRDKKEEESVDITKNISDFKVANNVNDNENSFSKKLDPRNIFDKFIVSEENKMAYMAAKSYLDSSSIAYDISSLYIYGETGLGKTHLLSSIAHELEENNLSYVFLSSERFSYFYQNSIRESKLIEFKEKFKDIDFFLLDDIHFLAGKKGTQQEIVNIIENLLANNKKVAFVGNCKLNLLNDFNVKLKSLISSGLSAEITAPKKNLKKDLICGMLEAHNFTLEEDFINLIANQEFSSIREIEGAIKKIVIYCNVLNQTLDKENLVEIISDFVVVNSKKRQSPEDMMKMIARFYKISLAELKSKSRKKEIVNIRDMAIFLMKDLTQLSLMEIGDLFSRDHATILYSVNKVKKIIAKDLTFKLEIAKIKDQVNNSL